MSAAPGGNWRLRAGLGSADLGTLAAPVSATIAVAVLLGASVLAGGGQGSGAVLWIGIASLSLVAALSAFAIAGLVPLPRLSVLKVTAVVAFVLLVLWMGLSVAWSIAPDLSWDYFNRALTYAGLLGIGLFFPVFVRRAPVVFAALLTLAVAAAVVWALAGKIDPSLFEDGFRKARLRDPVGYWNTLALLFAFGAPLALWVAARRHHPVARALGAGLLFLIVPAIMLTLSRSGILACVLALIAWIAFAPGRLETLVTQLLAVPAGVAIGQWAVGRPALTDDGQSLADRAADGRVLGWALALTFFAVFGVALILAAVEERRPLTDELRRRALRVIAYVAAGLAVVGLIVFVVRVGNPVIWVGDKVDEFQSPELISNDPSRLGSVNSNLRLEWWGEAASAFNDKPALGMGAGTFAVVHRLYRDNETSVTSPHSLLMQFLAEIGIVGTLLAATAALAGLLAAQRAISHLPDSQRLAGLALLIILVLFGAHSFVDIEWDFLAVCGPAFMALGVMLGGRKPLWLDRFPLLALAPVLVLIPVVLALLLPTLSSNRAESSSEVLFDNPVLALEFANQARALNPTALEPLFARADAEVVLGRTARARAAYLQAVALQPSNPVTWLQLTEFEIAEGELAVARGSWLRLNELDPHDCRVRELGITLELGGIVCGSQ